MIAAEGDGLDPLGFLAQRHARHAVEEGFLLHAAGVGQDHARVPLERHHVQKRHRVDGAHLAKAFRSADEVASALRVRGCIGKITTCSPAIARETIDNAAQRLA